MLVSCLVGSLHSGCSRGGAQAGASEPSGASCGACSAPRYCRNAECVVPGRIVVSTKPGTGPADLGLTPMDESDSEAPDSLAVSEADKRVYVLDQVNQRIQIFHEGRHERAIPLPVRTIDDMARLANGRFVLVSQGDNAFFVIGEDGALVQRLEFAALGLSEGELAWLHAQSDGVYVSRSDTELTRLFDRNGEVVKGERSVQAAAMSPDGRSLLKLGPHQDARLAFEYRGPGQSEWRAFELTLRSNPNLLTARAFDLDAQGNIYVLVEALWGKAPKFRRRAYLSVWSPELVEQRRINIASITPDYHPHHLGFLTPEGFFYYLDISNKRIAVRRY